MEIKTVDEEVRERQTCITYKVEIIEGDMVYHASVTVCKTYKVVGVFEDNMTEVVDIEFEEDESELPPNIKDFLEEYFYCTSKIN